MRYRKAIIISIGVHVILLTGLAVVLLTPKETPEPPPERIIATIEDPFPEPPEDPPPPEEKEKERPPIREPADPIKEAEVDPLPVEPAEPNPEFTGPIKEDALQGTGGDGPRVISKPSPIFPEEAREDGVSGKVVAILTIAPDGQVIDVEIVSAAPEGYFERATIKALKKWRYEEQLLTQASTGDVNRRVRVEIEFNLEDARRR